MHAWKCGTHACMAVWHISGTHRPSFFRISLYVIVSSNAVSEVSFGHGGNASRAWANTARQQMKDRSTLDMAGTADILVPI